MLLILAGFFTRGCSTPRVPGSNAAKYTIGSPILDVCVIDQFAAACKHSFCMLCASCSNIGVWKFNTCKDQNTAFGEATRA